MEFGYNIYAFCDNLNGMINFFGIVILLFVLGLLFGSFAGATVWRLRAAQLRADKRSGEDIAPADANEVAKLKKKSVKKDRSICLHCGHTLAWYDLIPLVSYAVQKGRCRYCHKFIGWFEPSIEIGLGLFFVVSYVFWPHPLLSAVDIARFVIWLVAGVGLSILFAYDAKWFLLPNVVMFPLIGLGLVNAALVIIRGDMQPQVILNVLYSCAMLGGLYYFIYVFSRHRWVGFGDVKLGLALGLLLSNWLYATLALFMANFIGTILVLPMLMAGKLDRRTHIPFGPLLISGWFIAGLFGASILGWYLGIVL